MTVTANYTRQDCLLLPYQVKSATKAAVFHIDDTTRTVSVPFLPPNVFTGTRMGRNEYSMSPDYQPRSGRHTLAGPLARSILAEMYWVGIPERGTITVSSETAPCRIGYYEVEVKPEGHYLPGRRYYVFVGKTADGRVLTATAARQFTVMVTKKGM